MRWVGELSRRNVLKVCAAYLATAWVLVQLTDIVAPALSLPDWTLRLVMLLLALGFPIAALLAWHFNITRDGLLPEEDPDGPRPARRRDWMLLAAIALLGIAVGVAGRHLLAPGDAAPASPAGATEAPGRQAPPSVAVLPFVNMGASREDGFFADGLSEEILNSLANVPGLKVAGRTSSFSYKGQERDLREIARELGVGHVIEGSVRRQGGQLRVTAQLIEAEGGFHLWSQTFDRTLDDALAIQREIAEAVADRLRLSVLPQATTAVPLDSRAQQDYLEAIGLVGEGSDGSMQRAVALLRPIQAAHPDFVPVYLPLADTVQRLGWYGRMPWRDSVAEMEALAEAAQRHAAGHIDTRVLAALVPFARNDMRPTRAGYEAVLATHRKLVEEAPNHALVHLNAADAARIVDEHALALSYVQRYIALEPRDPKGLATLADIQQEMGLEQEAIRTLERSIELAPGHYPPYFELARLHARMGRYEDALSVSERCLGVGLPGCTGALVDMYDMLRQDQLRDEVAATSTHPLMAQYLAMIAARRAGGYEGARRYVDAHPGTELQFGDELATAALESGEYQALLDLRARLLPDLVDPAATLLAWQTDAANEVCLALHQLGRGGEATRCFERVLETNDRRRAVPRPEQLPRAIALAWLGRGDEAIAEIEAEIGRGWRTERYLRETLVGKPEPLAAPLRDRADFQALMAAVQARNARDFEALRATGRALVPVAPARTDATGM